MRYVAVQIVVLFVSVSSLCASQKLGVVADERGVAFAEILEVILSEDDGIQLLERTSLSQLADEIALPVAERKATVLDAADFLVFVEALETGENSILAVRIVQTSNGASLLHRLLPSEGSVSDNATSMAIEIRSALQSNQEAEPEKHRSVSVAGLRFETPVSQGGSIEYTLNQILSARLNAHPEISVLERWRIGELLWEQGISEEMTAGLAGGDVTIGGALSESDGRLLARISIRAPAGNGDATISVEGRRNQLTQFVEQIVDEVCESISNSPSSTIVDTSKEATQYRELADWALGVSLPGEAVSAALVAHSLNPEDVSNRASLIRALFYEAWPVNIEVNPVDDVLNYKDISGHNFDWSGRLAAAASALDYWLEWVSESPLQETSNRADVHSQAFLGLNARTPVVWLLRKAIDEGRGTQFRSQLIEISEKYTEVVAKVAEIENPDHRWSVLSANLPWVSYWSPSPEKAIENARWMMQLPIDDGSNRLSVMRMLWGFHLEKEFVTVERAAVPNRRITSQSLHPELLVSSSGDSREALRERWNLFASELLEGAGYREQVDGALLHYYLNWGKPGAWPAAEKGCDVIWEHRALLASFSDCPGVGELNFCFEKSTSQDAPASYRDFNERFLEYLLENSTGIGTFCLSSLSSKKVDWSGVSRAKFQPKFAEYQKGLNVPEKIKEWHLEQLNLIESAMNGEESIPEKANEEASLQLTECFHPFFSNHRKLRYPPTPANLFFFGESFLWSIDESGLHRVDPESPRRGKVFSFPGDWGMLESSVAAFRDAVFVSAKDGLWRMERDGGEWTNIPFPGDALLQLKKSGDQLFVLFGPRRGQPDEGKGIAKLNRESLEFEVLVSSRRHPPRHILDGRADLTPFGAFQSGDQTFVSLLSENENGEKSGYLLKAKTDLESWEITSGNVAFPMAIRETRSGALLCLGGRWSGTPEISQISLFPHSGSEPVYLAATRKIPFYGLYKFKPFSKDSPQSFFPDNFRPTSGDVSMMVAATYHDGDLIVVTGDRYNRGSFREGKEKEIKRAENHRLHIIRSSGKTESIRLEFDGAHNIRESQQFKMTGDELQCFTHPSLSSEGIGVIGDSLIIGGRSYNGAFFGFWRIPLADLKMLNGSRP